MAEQDCWPFVDDHRLHWPEREFIRQIGERLYGEAEANMDSDRQNGGGTSRRSRG
jgi:hypothetical protein